MGELRRIFALGRRGCFESGMESDFSRELTAYIQASPVVALDELRSLIQTDSISPALVEEALRWVGLMGRTDAYAEQLNILFDGLSSAHASVRDAAALALSYLDDADAASALSLAIAREVIPELREDMRQVLKQLEERSEG